MAVRVAQREGQGMRDPIAVLEQLVGVCGRAARRLSREARDESVAVAVRRCAIELTLLAEACGAAIAPVPASSSHADEPHDHVLSEYRRALKAPLPRPIQTVLLDHVARLEACFGRAPARRAFSAVALAAA